MDSYHGVWRIQGSLAVSRAIGDRHLKKWVTAQPETKVVEIKAEHEFLILASDGLWDKVGDNNPSSHSCFSFPLPLFGYNLRLKVNLGLIYIQT